MSAVEHNVDIYGLTTRSVPLANAATVATVSGSCHGNDVRSYLHSRLLQWIQTCNHGNDITSLPDATRLNL
jgi:hypothetical protein